MPMNIVSATGEPATRFATYIPELVRATGPKSYRYIFGPYEPLYQQFMAQAWATPDNFFSHTQSVLALEGDAFRGVLIAHDGPEHYRLKDAVFPIIYGLVGEHGITPELITELAERADIASYMNPYVPNDCRYIIVVSVPEAARGKGAGRALMFHEIESARAAGYRTLHLDVMSDNPAVGLYSALGFETMTETITPILCRQHGIAMELRMVLTL
ncbi:MAG: GNAT family N-acetyltransferase [Parvibaculaceae bacterium]